MEALLYAAAALLVLGQFVRDSRTGVHAAGPASSQPWYAGAIAVMCVVAAGATRRPATRPLAVGVAAASIWGLVFFGHDLVRDLSADHQASLAYLDLSGHLILLVAAILVARRIPLVLRLPRDLGAVAALLVGAAAAIASGWLLASSSYDLARASYGEEQSRAYAVAAVLAVVVPLWASLMKPRPAGLAVLAGWIGGAFAICLTAQMLLPTHRSLYTAGAVLALGLSALAVAVRPLGSRALPGRRYPIVALAVVLAASGTGGVLANRLGQADPKWISLVAGVTLNPDGSRLYATVHRGILGGTTRRSELVVVDTAGKAVLSTIQLGPAANAPAVTPDGQYVYVADSETGTITLVSTKENATVGAPIPVGGAPSTVTVSRDGKRLYVLDSKAGKLSFVDTATNRPTGTAVPLTPDSGPTVVSPDGRTVYTANGQAPQPPYRLTVIDTATAKPTATVPLDGEPSGMAVSPDGTALYFGARVDISGKTTLFTMNTATRTLTKTPTTLNESLIALAASPDGRRLYISELFAGTVTAVDTKTGAPIGAPTQTNAGVALTVSPDGTRVYIGASSDAITILKTDSSHEVTQIPLNTN